MNTLRDRRRATAIAGAAFLASIASGIALFTSTASSPAASAGITGAAAILAAATVVVPTLLATAIVMLLAPVMRGGVPLRVTVIALMVLGLVATSLAALSWSVGFTRADAGIPQDSFTALALPLLAGALLLIASSTGAAWLSIWAGGAAAPWRATRAARIPIVVVASLLLAPVIAFGVIVPTGTILASCCTFVLGLVLTLRGGAEAALVRSALAPSPGSAAAESPGHGSPFPASDVTTLIPVIGAGTAPFRHAGATQRSQPSPRGAADRVVAARRATLLAWGSLATTVAVWGGGLIASIRLTGDPAATDVIRESAGAGHLAAIPLLLSLTVVFAVRMPGHARALWTSAAIVSAVLAACAAALAIASRDDGVLMFTLMPVMGIAVGAWAATAFWPRLTLPAPGRLASAVIIAIAGAFLYGTFVAMMGGITLILASAVLAAWGARAAALGGAKATGIRVSTV
jgi:hypothetical protein